LRDYAAKRSAMTAKRPRMLKSQRCRTDETCVEDGLQTARAELRGAAFLELGLYVRFAYAPFADWLRRRELSR
jgi:hypothetical protein